MDLKSVFGIEFQFTHTFGGNLLTNYIKGYKLSIISFISIRLPLAYSQNNNYQV